MRKLNLVLFFVLVFLPYAQASALVPGYIKASVPNAGIIGQARMTYMTMAIYDASLYAPNGQLKSERPLALSLTYLRNLSGEKIADRSIEEMRHQGFKDEVTLAAWHDTMVSIFPDVQNGTTLTGVLNNAGVTIFYKNNREIGKISDPSFGRHFFSIWLGSNTSEPDMRKNLLNLKG